MDCESTFSVAATIVHNFFELAGVALDNKSSPVSHDDIGIPDSLDFIGLFGEEEAFSSDQLVTGELKEPVVPGGVAAGVTPRVSGSMSDDCDLLSLPNTPIDEPDTNFFEVFTDLSAQIAQEYVAEQQQKELQENTEFVAMETISIEDIIQPCISPPSSVKSSCAASATQSRATLKRQARAMETTYADEMQIDADMQMSHVLASVESDHDYTLKTPKRPRRHEVTASRQDSDVSESPCSSISAALSEDTRTSPKEQKYFERRHKNNIASRRSRQTRKNKFATMEERAITLVEDNEALAKKIELMESLAKAMKDALIKKMAGK